MRIIAMARATFQVLSLAIVVASGALPQDTHTGYMANGRMWVELDKVAKVTFVAAVADALSLKIMSDDGVISSNDFVNKLDKLWATQGFTLKDYVAVLDALYKEPENRNIPVVAAINYSTDKLKGERNAAELDSQLIYLRKWSVELERLLR